MYTDKPKRTHIVSMLLPMATFVLVVMLSGCFGPATTYDPATLQQMYPRSEEIILGSGDEIEVKFLMWPELNEIQRVRPDGKISLQLIEDIKAAGLTTEQLRLLLQEKYKGKIKNPEILIIIRELASQQVYVTGLVNTPGPVQLQEQMTALEAIMAAGGFSDPYVSTIVIYRTIEDGIVSTSLHVGDYHGSKPQGADPFYVRAKDMIQVQ